MIYPFLTSKKKRLTENASNFTLKTICKIPWKNRILHAFLHAFVEAFDLTLHILKGVDHHVGNHLELTFFVKKGFRYSPNQGFPLNKISEILDEEPVCLAHKRRVRQNMIAKTNRYGSLSKKVRILATQSNDKSLNTSILASNLGSMSQIPRVASIEQEIAEIHHLHCTLNLILFKEIMRRSHFGIDVLECVNSLHRFWPYLKISLFHHQSRFSNFENEMAHSSKYAKLSNGEENDHIF
ncbi:hypothetical protein ACJX0J_006027, partial [Zea mays]